MRFLSPPLWIGVTLAFFRPSGKTPEVKDILKIFASGFANEYLASLITIGLKESHPGALPQGILLRMSTISSGEIGVRKIEYYEWSITNWELVSKFSTNVNKVIIECTTNWIVTFNSHTIIIDNGGRVWFEFSLI